MKDRKLSNSALFDMVRNESGRQLDKWGVQDRHAFEWLAYTTEELGELAQAISEWVYRGGSPKNVIKEAIQTATLSLKIAEIFAEEELCQK